MRRYKLSFVVQLIINFRQHSCVSNNPFLGTVDVCSKTGSECDILRRGRGPAGDPGAAGSG